MEMLENQYRADMSLDEAILLGIKTLYKSMEAKGEVPTIELATIDARTRKYRKLSEAEVKEFVGRADIKKPEVTDIKKPEREE
jgi:proteasome alpha subunit